MTVRFASLELEAWTVRNNARLVGDGRTRVGCAVQAVKPNSGVERTFTGCNIQHKYRCHDIHAEVCAISAAIAAGFTDIIQVFIAAEREKFTPCGSCLDWIFEFGGPQCVVSWQSDPDGEVTSLLAGDLMPHYPA